MVKGNIEEALNLCSVQVDGNNAGYACSFQQISHQFCSDRFTTTSFAVLASIAIVRNNCGDMVSRSAFESVNHNQKFHYVIVNDGTAGGLYDKYVFTTYAFVNHYLNFAIIETVNHCVTNSGAKICSDFTC